ncbi:MAG: hypothetical protein ABI632_10355, partial [Pseudolysinimonas sp.]
QTDRRRPGHRAQRTTPNLTDNGARANTVDRHPWTGLGQRHGHDHCRLFTIEGVPGRAVDLEIYQPFMDPGTDVTEDARYQCADWPATGELNIPSPMTSGAL